MSDWPILISLALGSAAIYLSWVRQALRSRRQQNIRYDLYEQRRYAEAADALQTHLAQRLPAGQEAQTRQLLAETLEALGKTEEAASERERCRAVALGAGKDPFALIVHADLLSQENQGEEACVLYKKALTLARADGRAADGRAEIWYRLAAAQHSAGRSEEAVRSAEAALRGRISPALQMSLHQIIGSCLAREGLLEEAETYFRRILALAESEEKPEQVSDALADLAGLQYRRGLFTEAIADCQKAEAIYSGPSRHYLSVQAACLRDMGRFEEAQSIMQRYRQGPLYPQPRFERRMQVQGSLSLAWIEAYAARPEAALAYVEEAREGLKALSASAVWPPPPLDGEHFLVLFCDATEAYIQAQLKQGEQARRLAVSVESRLPQVGQSRDTRVTVYGFLGSAALERGDLPESRRLWHLYLQCDPDPVGLPSAYLELGEGWLRLGEMEQASTYFKQATALGIDSLDARRAQSRLDELGLPG